MLPLPKAAAVSTGLRVRTLGGGGTRDGGVALRLPGRALGVRYRAAAAPQLVHHLAAVPAHRAVQPVVAHDAATPALRLLARLLGRGERVAAPQAPLELGHVRTLQLLELGIPYDRPARKSRHVGVDAPQARSHGDALLRRRLHRLRVVRRRRPELRRLLRRLLRLLRHAQCRGTAKCFPASSHPCTGRSDDSGPRVTRRRLLLGGERVVSGHQHRQRHERQEGDGHPLRAEPTLELDGKVSRRAVLSERKAACGLSCRSCRYRAFLAGAVTSRGGRVTRSVLRARHRVWQRELLGLCGLARHDASASRSARCRAGGGVPGRPGAPGRPRVSARGRRACRKARTRSAGPIDGSTAF